MLRRAFAYYNGHYDRYPILTICITNGLLAGLSDVISQTCFPSPAPPITATTAKHLSTTDSSAQDSTLHTGDLPPHHPQQGQRQGEGWDLLRTGRFMFYNFSIAPLVHTWYSVLDRNFPVPTPSQGSSSMESGTLETNNSRTTRKAQAITTGSRTVTAAAVLPAATKRMLTDQVLFAPFGLIMFFSGLTLLEGGGIQEIKQKLDSSYWTALRANYTIWPLVQLVNFSVMPLSLRLPFVSIVGIVWNSYLSLVNTRGLLAEHHH